MSKYKFTIITVCYNAEKDIARTIKSVLQQDYKEYEYIIKDGLSTDQTMNVVNSMVDESENIHIISEKDQSLYDAMNIAVAKAIGEYIFFLNAGDCFCDENVLKRTSDFIKSNEADIVYGDVIHVSSEKECVRKYGWICGKKSYFLSGDCICHQALFAKRTLFDAKKFDLKYKVCADKDWELFQIASKVSLKPMGFTVAIVLVEGFARSHVEDFERETRILLEKYCPWTVWIYKFIMFTKKNPMILHFFRLVEKVCFQERVNKGNE